MCARKARGLPTILMLIAASGVLSCDVVTEPLPIPTTADAPVSGCPGYAIPARCPPFPTGGSNVISGVLLERTALGTRPFAGGGVWAWVQLPGAGYSTGRAATNADGEYQVALLPNALVVLQAAGGKYDQPCASIVELSSPTATASIEIVSEDAPIVDADPPPPALTGVVYEMTSNGRQPVPRARVFFETLLDIVAATTTTDHSGRYSMCRLPSLNSFVTPVKDGYVIAGRPVVVSGVMQLDLEMQRQ